MMRRLQRPHRPNRIGKLNMLSALRNASKSWVMKGILLLLAATFVVFFGGDIGGGGGHSGGGGNAASVLEVGDQNFTIHQVTNEFNDELQQAAVRSGQRLNVETAINRGLLDQTVSRLASQSLFDQAAQNLGVAASVDAASDTIRNLPQFQDSTGRFSRSQFQAFLGNQGRSEADFVNDVRLDLLRNQYIGTIQNAIRTPLPLTETLHARLAERRVAELVTIPAATSSDIANPDEAQLSEFYGETNEVFETPEFRTATLATLDVEQLATTVAVPEEEIQEEYEARSNEFQIPETRDVIQASLLSRADAERALTLISGGKSLVEAAEEVSGLPPVNLGTVRRAGIALPELAEAAFSLSSGTISKPVESTLGWHLVEVSNIAPGRTVPFTEAREGIREELARAEAVDRIFDVLNDVEDGLAGGASLDEVARDANLNVSKIDGIARNGQTVTGTPEDNPAMTIEVLTRLFDLTAAGTAEVVENRAGNFTVVRLDQIMPPRIPELAEIRDRVVEAWKTDRANARAEETAAQIAERAKNGESLEALAAEFNGRFQTTEPFDRTGNGATVPGALIPTLFEAQEGDILDQPISSGAATAKLTRIQAADQTAPERENLTQAISGQLANEIVNQLADALQRDIPVDVDRQAIISALTGQ